VDTMQEHIRANIIEVCKINVVASSANLNQRKQLKNALGTQNRR